MEVRPMTLKKVIGLSALAIAIAGGFIWTTSVTDATNESPLAEKVEQGTAHINDEQPMFDRIKDKSVVKKIQDSWDRALKVLKANKIEAVQDDKAWKLINSGDVDIEFTNHLTQKEAFSFNAAFNSEVRNKALKPGDYWPALLLNKSEGKAILFWERVSGEVVVVNLNQTLSKGATPSWSVEGPAVEYK